MQKTLRQHLEMVYKSRISAGNLCCTVSQERFLARKMRIRTMSIIPKLFLGVEYCTTFQAALYIETHSLMHQSEFHGASVALSRAADERNNCCGRISRNCAKADRYKTRFFYAKFLDERAKARSELLTKRFLRINSRARSILERIEAS